MGYLHEKFRHHHHHHVDEMKCHDDEKMKMRRNDKDVTPRQGGNARRKQEWISSQHMVEFKRISLTGFRSASSSSRFPGVSMQIHKSHHRFFPVDTSLIHKNLASHLPRACLMLAKKDYHLHCGILMSFTSAVLDNYHKRMR
ncbi:hypothetical protein Tco_1386088 [Tanacetum coccineum]